MEDVPNKPTGSTPKSKLWILANAGSAVGAVVIAFLLGVIIHWALSPAVDPAATTQTGAQAEKTLWTCSMHPEVQLLKPGLCPKCRMKLYKMVPGTAAGLREITVSDAAMATNRLCRTIEVSDQEGLTGELAVIEKALAGKAELDPYSYTVVGRRCRIRSGPFRGLEGVVVRRNRLACIVLEVSILGQGASMEIEADFLELID